MPERNEIIATLLLQMTVSDQKPERTLSSLVETMVTKYGERGFALAPDEMLHDLFTRLYKEPHLVSAHDDGRMYQAIMHRGLRHLLSRGWSADEVVSQVVAGYGARVRVSVSESELRAFVRAALDS